MKDFAWWAAKWWIAVLFGGMLAGCKYLYNKKKKAKEEKLAAEQARLAAMEDNLNTVLELLKLHSTAMISMLYDRLNQAYIFFDERGYCTPQDRHNCLKMFKIYKELGGNDNMENIMEKMLALPIKGDNAP